jgi:hypothetical protein
MEISMSAETLSSTQQLASYLDLDEEVVKAAQLSPAEQEDIFAKKAKAERYARPFQFTFNKVAIGASIIAGGMAVALGVHQPEWLNNAGFIVGMGGIGAAMLFNTAAVVVVSNEANTQNHNSRNVRKRAESNVFAQQASQFNRGGEPSLPTVKLV